MAGPINIKALPRHGPIKCRDCWQCCEVAKSEQVTSDGKFRLVYDPGAWGSSNPEVLVLGISKGNTQAKEFQQGEFDRVPFKNCRPRLRDALAVVGLINANENLSQRMLASEQKFAFGSVVRCSMTGDRKGAWSAGTPDVIPAFSHPEARVWLSNCFKRYLKNPPSRLKVIALAGNDDRWIKVVSGGVENLYPNNFRRINQVSYLAGGKLWVHIGHPSPGNGHFKSFIEGPEDKKQGQKRILAKKAVRDFRRI